MGARGTAVQLVTAAVLAAAGGDAPAQTTYLCAANGRSWLSPQPCPDGATTRQRLVMAPRNEPRLPSLPGEGRPLDRPPEHQQFQSPRCAELAEAIRTGAARGLERSTQRELQDAYRQQCAFEESRARGLLVEERTRQREGREREERAARLELDRAKLDREQCAEMKRILQAKRQRVETMTPGERGDLERFETTWRSRCTP